MELNRFREIASGFADRNVLVVGDLMLDTYLWGDINRISPEAPVPIVEVKKIEYNPGGAANVALNLASLGCKVSLIGLIGTDAEGTILKNLLDQRNIICTDLVISESRPTTVKSRIIAHNQQVVRADREMNKDLSESSNDNLIKSVKAIIEDVDAVILGDYNKGVLNLISVKAIIDAANNAGKPVACPGSPGRCVRSHHRSSTLCLGSAPEKIRAGPISNSPDRTPTALHQWPGPAPPPDRDWCWCTSCRRLPEERHGSRR